MSPEPRPQEGGKRGQRQGSGGGRFGRRRSLLLARPVAQRRVAAGDADGVEPAGAELLVARGGDEAGPRRGAGLAVVHPIVLHQHFLLTHVLHVDGAVDDEVWRGAVVCHLLTLVALDLQSQP